MKLFKLEFEGRLRGAIGKFYKITQTEKASTEESAKNILRLKYEINGFYSCVDISEYQGWTNSKTWSAAYLVNQERSVYKNLTAIRKERLVTGNDVKSEFERLNLKCDVWTIGVINWQEIADEHYNKD